MTPTRHATFRRKLKRQASGVEPFFADSFVGGVRNNANGFVWGGGTYVTVSADRAYTGSHSLKFTFSPDVEYEASWAEQRFDLGRYVTEFAVDYQLYIPSNFTHNDQVPGFTENNKFFALWRDVYSDVVGGTQAAVFEYWREGDGDSNLRSMCRMTNPVPGEQLISDIIGDEFRPTLISPTGPLFKGQWNRIRIAAKGSSARGVSDGYLKLWIGDTLFRNYTNFAIWNAYTTPTDVVFRNGYFLGYVNSNVTEVQEWFVDDVKFYDANPWGSG
jgi:hypothetical protein